MTLCRHGRPLREYVFEDSPVHVVLRAGIELTEFMYDLPGKIREEVHYRPFKTRNIIEVLLLNTIYP